MFIILILSGYLFIRFYYLKAKDFKPDESKATSPLDLRPAIIAKLQQLVKDGSNGLYRLTIEKIEPDLAASTLEVTDATLIPDSVSIQRLDRLKQLPDDVFRIRVHKIHIDGIGVTDLLHKDRIDVKNIQMSSPEIEVYHKLDRKSVV